MKTKIMAAFLPFMFIVCCGCSGGLYDSPPADLTSSQDEIDYDIVSEYEESSETAKVLNGLYYANINSKKFHYNYCEAANKIKNENLYITEFRDELINEGYVPCQICNP